MSTDFMWDYLNKSNKLLDPTLDTVMQNLPFLRFIPSRFRTFFNDVMNKRNKVLDFFFKEQQVRISQIKLPPLPETEQSEIKLPPLPETEQSEIKLPPLPETEQSEIQLPPVPEIEQSEEQI